MFKPPCPFCQSTNTYQHSNNQIYEEYGLAQTYHRCNKCKKYFYRTSKIVETQYTFHSLVVYDYINNKYQPILNPKRDDPPN